MRAVPPIFATARDPGRPTYGRKVAKLGAAMGMPLMPWQDLVADTALELDHEGLYRYSTIVLTVPRQSGKTSLLRPVIAHRALTTDKGRIWITAQLRQDAADTWAETADLIQESPLGDLVKRRDTNGSECVTFNGTKSTIRIFNAGARKALHGKQSDLVFIDEAWGFSGEQGDVILQAVLPTQATRPGAQTWIVSTAGTAASQWLWSYIKRGRQEQGPGSRTAYFEWGIPPDTEDLTDLDLYVKHHPAIGHTIRRSALETAWESMKPGEFARAYGNFWTSSAEWVIAPAVWAKAATAESVDRRRPLSIGVEVRADRSGGCIVVCGPGRDTGRPTLEVVAEQPGIGWLVPKLQELLKAYPRSTVVIDPVSPAGTVHRELEEQRRRRTRVPLAPFTASELVDGHTEFLDDLVAGRLGQPGEPALDAALAATTSRSLRETTVFSRLIADDGTSPALVIACVLAHHGYRQPVESDAPALHVVTG